jgi:hypothetical protein
MNATQALPMGSMAGGRTAWMDGSEALLHSEPAAKAGHDLVANPVCYAAIRGQGRESPAPIAGKSHPMIVK